MTCPCAQVFIYRIEGIKIKSSDYDISDQIRSYKYADNERLHLYWERAIQTINQVNISLVIVVLKVIREGS